MGWRQLPIIAFDTETTGLNPEDGQRVIEFAGVEFRLDSSGAIATMKRHEWLINPGVPIPRETTEINHITDDDVAGKPSFSEVAGDIHRLLTGAVLVAHNLPFDQKFLTHEFMQVGMRWPVPAAEIDTIPLSRQFFPDARSHKLGELCKRLEISLEEAHRAGNDAEACGRCFLTLAERQRAPDEIEGLADWGEAIVDPPDTGHLRRDDKGVIVFVDGPHQGKPALEHLDTLSWMTMARERKHGVWDWRYPERVRRWVDRWLRMRASGIFPQGMKGFGPNDWGIDPPIGSGA